MKKNITWDDFTFNNSLEKLIRIMKIYILLSVITILQLNAANTYSQNARINLNIKDGTLEEVFKAIENQSDFEFLYNNKQLDANQLVSINAQNMLIAEVLNNILSGKSLSYQVIDKRIVLVQQDSYESKLLKVLKDQQIKITGRVTDASTGEYLPGVTIQVEGTAAGTITDIDGKYSIEVPNGNAILIFSYIGYNVERIELNGRNSVDVSLIVDIKVLEEVVVVGYGTQQKINLTGSVASIKSEKIENVPVADLSNVIVGKIPGIVAVNRSGEPGRDSASVSIRGFHNMLVIVDGVEQPFNQVDPNSVESINILKDASASIYGARAGNGVMLVTTKRGKEGRPKFNLNSYFGFESPTRTPKLVNASNYASMLNEIEIDAGRDPIYTSEEIEKYKQGTDPNYPNTDWYKETFRKRAPIQHYNINTTGGSERINYFFSLGYLDQEGMLRSGDTKFKRYNINSNIDAKISKSFTVSIDLTGRLEKREYPGSEVLSPYGNSISRIMEDLYFARPTFHANYPDASKLPYVGIAGMQPVGRSISDISGYTHDNQNFYSGKLTLKYDLPFLDGFFLKTSFTYSAFNGYQKAWGKQITTYNYDWASNLYSVAGQFGKNQLDESVNMNHNLTSQFFAGYNKKWGLHNIDALLVGEVIQKTGNEFSASREGYITTAIDQLFAGGDLNKNNDGSAWQDGRIGYVGRLNYNYGGKYLAEATFRYDASAKFDQDNRWGFFPAFSIGWRLSEEKFLKSLGWLDNLKLRASYGKAGNDYVGNYNYLTGYKFGGSYVYNKDGILNNGIQSKGLSNPDLTWETTSTVNGGIDASIFKNLLGFEFDCFYRKVVDVPGYRSASLPSTFGAVLPEENINSYDNRGFEVALTHKNHFGDFNYDISGNFSYSRSKWIHYDESVFADEETKNRLQRSGQWINRWFGYEALGYFQTQEEIDNWDVIQDNNNNSTLQPGDIKYLDYNGDKILNFKDEHVIGKGTTPDIIFGVNLAGNFKGFDLSMLWQGAANFNAYFTGESQNPFYNGAVPYEYQTDYWTPENRDAKYPRLVPGGAPNNNFVSTFWLQNAAYLRLKNLQFGYSLPKKLLSKIHVETFRLYLSMVNMVTFDNVYPFDPETGTGRGWHYPQKKTVSLGINLSF